MKILVSIPFLYGAESSKEAIMSLGDVDIFALNNGASEAVVEVLDGFKFYKRIDLPKNVYVNPAWNIFIKYFLESDYEYLIIMNSDLVMRPNWREVCEEVWTKEPNTIILPDLSESGIEENRNVKVGIPGIFITLNKEQAKMVYPIPDYIKVWYGDDWIFKILANFYDIIIIKELRGRHYGSQSIKTQDIFAQIDKDKIAWNEKGLHDSDERIKQIKG